MGKGTLHLIRGRATILLAGLLAIMACSDSNGAPSEETHTPASAALIVDGTASDDPILLLAGTALPVEIKFFNVQGTEITGIEGDHFAKLTIAPSTLATVADVPGQNFHKTVTASSEVGSGIMTIGYGHDAAADELSFGPYNVTVVVAAGVE